MFLVYYLIALILLLIVFIYLSAWFSGTETALTNLTTAQIAEMSERKDENVKYIKALKDNMDRTLTTILIGNNVVNIILSSVSALITNAIFKTIGVSIMVGVITFLLVIFGEITPKSRALMHSQEIASRNSRKIFVLMKFASPLIHFFLFISRKVLALTGDNSHKVRLHVSDDSIKGLASMKVEQGTLKKIEKDIIHKVFRFGDRKIEDIMVPISEVFMVKNHGTIKEVRLEVAKHGFTRVPVINDDDQIIGILYAKDLLGIKDGPIESMVREPFEIYPNEDITDVFDSMELRRNHMAIIKDLKTSKQIGIVTLEDILEEIVGEIHDESTHLQEED